MIPKVIHYCWLSGDEYPDSIRRCIDSWKEHLPDYEFRLWDLNRFDINSTLWTQQAFLKKKYAFAADYIRLYALYYEGGIYLDSDVVVYKSFNELLHLPYFIGEDRTHCFEPAIIGCEEGMPWIKDVMKRYEDLAFVNKDGSFNMRGLPIVFRDQLHNKYKFYKQKDCHYQYESDVIRIMPYSFFNSRDFIGSVRYKDSFCSHNYLGSWLKKKQEAGSISFIKKIMPRPIVNAFYRLFYWTIGKASLKNRIIEYKKDIY